MRILILLALMPLSGCMSEQRMLNPYSTSTPGIHRAKDPVCGQIIESNTLRKKKMEDVTYYFCSDECMYNFKRDPASFVMR